MYWLEVSVRADREAVEAICEVFAREAYGGVAIDEDITPSPDGDGHAYDLDKPVTIKAYFPVDDEAGEKVERLRSALGHLSFLRPVEALMTRRLAEEDWANAWKEHYHVLHIGQRLVIVPSWREYAPAPGEAVLRLDPGMAFGTGLHPTTQACLERLETLVEPGMSVLDVGTGSGILGIAAARLGAASVLAVDTDPVAVAAARGNVALNGLVDVIAVREGSLPLPAAWGASAFDLVLANIIGRVIMELAGHLVRAVRPGGIVIASGIIVEQAQAVEEHLLAAGFRRLRDDTDGDWVTLTLTVGDSLSSET